MTDLSKYNRPIEAFILAAGKGSRLGALTAELPKCLIEVGGRTLLDRSLSTMAAAGLSSVRIVVGFNGQMIRAHVESLALPLAVRIVENPYWSDTGSVVSLDLAVRDCAPAWGLVVESDLLYHPEFLTHALRDQRDRILVADASGSGDEVWVAADNAGHLSQLGKQMPQAERARAVGEFAGISLFSPAMLETFSRHAGVLLAEGRAAGHYEELVFELSQCGNPVAVDYCPNLPWTEIDTPADLQRAIDRVYPALASRAG
jgi:choline kinase